MTRARLPLVALVPVVALLACATPRAGGEDSAAMRADTTTLVMLSRGACHGTCPVYAVRLAANGHVRFVGARFVRQVGVDTTRVPTAAVEALRTAFSERKFSNVPSVIEYGAAACGPYIADLPTVELTARGTAGEHRVRFDQGCRNHPSMLDTLANMVDSISGSSRWTTFTRP
jgi:Domain of unknown function (DUF6438)